MLNKQLLNSSKLSLDDQLALARSTLLDGSKYVKVKHFSSFPLITFRELRITFIYPQFH